MIIIKELFFEIIRVAIGAQASLSQLPSADEWDEIFELANRQSLVGITFIALQKMGADADEGYTRIGISEDTYFTWMGVAGKIHVQNEILNQQCVKVQEELQKAGFESCILKGQGVASYYSELSGFRQSGDIDVWVLGTNIPQLVEYVKDLGADAKATYAHVAFEPFEDTEVELHPRPAFLRCFWRNARLQKWIGSFDVSSFEKTLGFTTPPLEFNLVYLLLHMYHHVVYEGVGLRQLMDYYFVLRACKVVSQAPREQSSEDGSRFMVYGDTICTIESFGLKRFAQGVMWIMQEVFGLEEDKLLFEADAKIGQLLLNEVMEGGNFGHHDKSYKELQSQNLFVKGWGRLQKKWRFTSFAFWDIVCSPFWSLWQICWRKYHGYY